MSLWEAIVCQNMLYFVTQGTAMHVLGLSWLPEATQRRPRVTAIAVHFHCWNMTLSCHLFLTWSG